ncbi:sensor histidine kinase [Streptomyces sp. 8N616]|uniref:sensor histidine kinase n=1 Tax=Streptomyces sp. 8N616 TaxID=3457414 RepID=UPI003FD57B34
MPGFLRPLARTVTYTRWLHVLISAVFPVTVWMVYPGVEVASPAGALLMLVLPLPLLAVAAVVPAVRLAEGVQARLLLSSGAHAGHRHGDPDSEIAVAPSATWADRWRTALWLVLRLGTGLPVAFLSVHLPLQSVAFTEGATGGVPDDDAVLPVAGHHWWYALLALLPLVVLAAVVVGTGALMAAAARRLLGRSPAERLAALEERTDRLLEHNRLARELHDSIGHALTVAVVQAGAARAAGSAEFTDRALAAIEDTGRHALEDLERVLRLLRDDPVRKPAERPTLADAGRLVESARASGAAVTADVTGPVAGVPGPVSREGYRIVQEALTNALRHAGPSVRVALRIAVSERLVELDVRNPLDAGRVAQPNCGRGLRGIRERAVLLGGEAETGPYDGDWRVRASLPLDRAAP